MSGPGMKLSGLNLERALDTEHLLSSVATGNL